MKIEKCPFCGEEPQFYFKGGTYGYTPDVYYIECKCGKTCNCIKYVKRKTVCDYKYCPYCGAEMESEE